MRWKELMYRTTGVTIDAETAMSDFTPSLNATLIGVEIIAGGIAATSLIENGYIKLVHAPWAGRDLYCPFQGIGLETVPRAAKKPWVTSCNLPVKAGTPMKGFYYHNVTPVTPEITVFGIFEG